MPLHTSQLPSSIAQAPSPAYLIFWASGTPSWCPDCRNAEPAVHAVFGRGPTDNHGGPVGFMIYVGDVPTWRDPNNHYRVEYQVQRIPTILRWENGKETGRLEEAQCQDETKLRAFTERTLYRVSPSALIPSGSVANSLKPSLSLRPTQPREPPGMKAVLSADALKTFNHALTCLGKFGDNLCLQATRTEEGSPVLRLSTINSSSSAFAAFFFFAEFFEELVVRLREDYEPTRSASRGKVECQLHAKALGSILKSRLNRGLERCEIHIVQPWSSLPSNTNANYQTQAQDGSIEARLLLRLHCAHGVVKTHKLTYEPKKSLYPTADPFPGCSFVVGPRTASEWLDHFLSGRSGAASGAPAAHSAAAGPAGEVSLHCGPDFCIVKNKEIDLAGRMESRASDPRGTILRSIQTQVRIEMQEFIAYDVKRTVHLTFPLKEFKAAIALAEALNLSLEVRFGIDDQPLFIVLNNAPQIPTSTATHAASGNSATPRPTFETGQPTLRIEFVLATTHEADPAGADANAVGAGHAETAGGVKDQGARSRAETANGHDPRRAASQDRQHAQAGSSEGRPRSTGQSSSLPPPEAVLQSRYAEIKMEARDGDGDQPLVSMSQENGDSVLFQPSQGAAEEEMLLQLEQQQSSQARPPSTRPVGPSLQAASHGHFVLNPSQMSATRNVDDSVLERLRSGQAPFESTPMAAAKPNGDEPTASVAANEEGHDLQGTPWGATAALAGDDADGMVSPFGARAASPLAQAQMEDAFFDDGDGGVHDVQEDEDDEDDDEGDPPPTPTPPSEPETGGAGHDALGEDEVERLRRRKKYRPIF